MAATGLLVWAGALQANMWYMTSSSEYKSSQVGKAGDENQSWTVSFRGLFGGAQQKSGDGDGGGVGDGSDGR